MASGSNQLTALLIGGTGATGKEVLKELNKSDLISKIIFISRRALEFPDQPKVQPRESLKRLIIAPNIGAPALRTFLA